MFKPVIICRTPLFHRTFCYCDDNVSIWVSHNVRPLSLTCLNTYRTLTITVLNADLHYSVFYIKPTVCEYVTIFRVLSMCGRVRRTSAQCKHVTYAKGSLGQERIALHFA